MVVLHTKEGLPIVSLETIEGFSSALGAKRLIDSLNLQENLLIYASPSFHQALGGLERDLENFMGHIENSYTNPEGDNPILAEYTFALLDAIDTENIEDFSLITPSEMFRDGFFVTYKLLKNQLAYGDRKFDSLGLPMIEEDVAKRTLSVELKGQRNALEEMLGENPHLYGFGIKITEASPNQKASKDVLQKYFCSGFAYVLELLRRQHETNLSNKL